MRSAFRTRWGSEMVFRCMGSLSAVRSLFAREARDRD